MKYINSKVLSNNNTIILVRYARVNGQMIMYLVTGNTKCKSPNIIDKDLIRFKRVLKKVSNEFHKNRKWSC